MLPLDYTNGQSEYYYAPKNVKERDHPPPLATCAQQFPELHMIVARFTWRGLTRALYCAIEDKNHCRIFHQASVDADV